MLERKIKVYDFDFQKSFYYKWKEDEQSDLPKLYEVETIGEDHGATIFRFWNPH